jgi:hypothetical protein
MKALAHRASPPNVQPIGSLLSGFHGLAVRTAPAPALNEELLRATEGAHNEF